MADLNSEYNKIIKDIEKKIKDPEDQKYVKEKITDMSMIFIKLMDKLTNMTENKMSEIQDNQMLLENRLSKLEGIINGIENDIYSDEDFDMEIVCPYCNHEFTIDIGSGKEIKCPECENIIELDWDDEYNGLGDNELDFSGCPGSCDSCGGCHDEEDEDEDM